MSELHGPLDKIPLENYCHQTTLANYMGIKQIIDQVINEDQEYVSWKLKNHRTGSLLDKFICSYKLEADYKKENRLKIREHDSRELKVGDFYDIPSGMKFQRDIYEEKLSKLPRPRNLDQTSVRKLFADHLDDEQMNRYEVFKRASLAKNQIKKISGIVTNQTVAANVNLLLGGIGKIIVGEIVEKALEVKQKWLLGMMVNKFHERKVIGNKLKRHFKRLTIVTMGTDSAIDDEVDEQESEHDYDNDKEARVRTITTYNTLVGQFNKLDVNIEKFVNSPLLPEHIHEAWRLYRIENDTTLGAPWCTQGEPNGLLFR